MFLCTECTDGMNISSQTLFPSRGRILGVCLQSKLTDRLDWWSEALVAMCLLLLTSLIKTMRPAEVYCPSSGCWASCVRFGWGMEASIMDLNSFPPAGWSWKSVVGHHRHSRFGEGFDIRLPLLKLWTTVCLTCALNVLSVCVFMFMSSGPGRQ